MADNIQTLLVSLEAKMTQFEKTMAKSLAVSDKTAGGIEKRFKKMNQLLASSGGAAFAGFAKGALLSAASAISVGAAITGAKDALDAFGKIADNAKSTGLDAEFFQGLAHQAKLGGVEFDALSGSLETFNKNAGLAVVGKGKMYAALKALDPALLQNIRSATTQEERVRLAADAIDKQSTAAGKAAVANVLFGNSGSKLVGVFAGGARSIDEAAAAAQKMGIIVDNSLIARADELGDKFDTVTQVLDLQFKRVLVELAPLLIDVAESANSMGDSFTLLPERIRAATDYLERNKDIISQLVGYVGKINDLIANVPALNPFKSAADGLTAIDTILTSLRQSTPDVQAAKDALADYFNVLYTQSAQGAGIVSPEDLSKLKQLTEGLVEGKTSAAEAKVALQAIGDANPDLSDIITQLGTLADALGTVKSQALGMTPSQILFRNADYASLKTVPKPDTPTDTPPLPPIIPGTKTPAEKFSDTIDQKRTELAQLREQAALQATLNPLVEDYGYALEKLHIQQELQLAAQRAGIDITPKVQLAIDQLADGHARAAVEAAKLAEAQDRVKQSAEEWRDVAKDAVGGFINDLVQGKSALESLGDALTMVGNKLLSSGLDALFGGGSGGSGLGILGDLLNLPGRANGGPVTAGKPYVVGERRAEVFVPGVSGRIVPQVPSLSGAGGGGGSISAPVSIHIDATGADPAGLARVQAEVRSLKAGMPALVIGAVRNAKRTRNL